MRCLGCGSFCFGSVCSGCKEIYLGPKIGVRSLPCGLEVLSFYAYDDIEPFLLTKHSPRGWGIYRLLAKEAFRALVPDRADRPFAAIPVDDDIKSGYSHTAILAAELKRYGYRPLFDVLKPRNRVSYSGRSLSFRLENPRDFKYSGPQGIEAIIVDDIVTTGLTLSEAKAVLEGSRVSVKRALVLADASR